MKKGLKNTILSLIIFSFILMSFPKPVFAGLPIVSDFLEASGHALEGVEEGAAPIVEEFNNLVFRYLKALLFLSVSAGLLDWIMDEPIQIRDSILVQSGWRFTMGLANLFFVLAIIVIAFAHILKLETFQTKKALPRLIIAILLINFSLLFIGMLIDVSTFLQKTILPEERSLALDSVNAVVGGIKGAITKIAGVLVTKTALSMLPGIGPATQFGIVALLAFVWLPWMASWLIQIYIAFALAGVYFLYFVLFAFRIYVIQILAIFAPLAIAFWALPFKETQTIFSAWLKFLISWVFLGIVLLFFIVMGFNLVIKIMPGAGPDLIPVYSWFNLDKYFAFYAVFIIYMAATLFFSAKFAPMGAEKILESATPIGTAIWARGLKPIWGGIKTLGREAVPETWRREAEKMAMAPPPSPRKMVARATWAIKREIGKAISPEVEISNIEKVKEGAKKIKTPEILLGNYRAAETRVERIGTLAAAIEKGWHKQLEKLGLAEQEIIREGKEALAISPEAFRPFRTAYPHLAERMGIGLSEETRRKGGVILTDEDRKKGYSTLTIKIVAEMSPKDIESLSPKALENNEVKEAIHGFWKGNQIGTGGRTFGKDFVDSYMKEADTKGLEWYMQYNPRVLRYLQRSGAEELGFHLPKKLGRPPTAPPPGEGIIPTAPTPPYPPISKPPPGTRPASTGRIEKPPPGTRPG